MHKQKYIGSLLMHLLISTISMDGEREREFLLRSGVVDSLQYSKPPCHACIIFFLFLWI